ncbi:MAG TPA: glycoside hydrolase family 9 protein [Polyangiaceae bacterium]|jgi:hypothetical protein
MSNAGSGNAGSGNAGSGNAGASNGGSAGTGTAGTGTAGTGGAVTTPNEPLSKYIVVDQFGYRPGDEKIAVLRDPQTGYDSAESFAPGQSYALVDAASGAQVFTAAPSAWNAGATDTSSGDKAWWFDFSSVTTPGTYYVLDLDNQLRSDLFDVSDTVYREVLKRAVRMLFYQRVGQAKDAEWAGAGWADTADHVGPLQDHDCRLFSAKTDATTAHDLWGGWYDAGDMNKYTNWTANYIVQLLRGYLENPSVWRDDYEIPESGNGIPDILDEAKWGMDYLTRLQQPDGSVLSIVGEAGGSPPSSATGQSLYGPANTSAALSSAAAFAYGATVFASVGDASLTSYAADLKTRATQAWTWAVANPSVVFMNNDKPSGSQGLGAGQQEVNDNGRLLLKLEAACYLFEATADAQYRTFFDANYAKAPLIAQPGYLGAFDTRTDEVLLHYTQLSGATAAVVAAIKAAYKSGMNTGDNFPALSGNVDPYLAQMKDYVWGSNSTKASQGLLFLDLITYGIDVTKNTDAERGAERYIHYVHGVNPYGMVYLTNMYAYGAASSANELYHTWFTDGSALWDRVGTATYGPAPGYLVGGPNPSYAVDACCGKGTCGSPELMALCTAPSLAALEGQPKQKSYLDFNANYPQDSWQITEPDDGYQLAYIRLLARFAK